MHSRIRTTAFAAVAIVLVLLWIALFRVALGANNVLLLATAIAILLWAGMRLVMWAAAAIGRRRRTARLAALARQCCADDVRFEVRRPAYLVPETWTPLLVQVYRSVRDPAVGERHDPVAELALRAERLLGEDAAAEYVTATEDSIAPVPRDAELRFVPDVPGCRFNPPIAVAAWSEAVLAVPFRMKADRELDGDTARGRISIFAGPLLLAEMAVVVRVTSEAQEPAFVLPDAEVVAPYRKVFASYSHRDEAIVRQMEVFARAFGDDFMRDVTELRAGEEWSPRIEQMIEDADVFQLFWSSHSIRSEYVAREWRHALSLRRQNFIRPIYWEQPLPALPERDLPPDELKRIHFQRLPFDFDVKRSGMAPVVPTVAVAVLAGLIVTMQTVAPPPDSMAYDETLPMIVPAPEAPAPPVAAPASPDPGPTAGRGGAPSPVNVATPPRVRPPDPPVEIDPPPAPAAPAGSGRLVIPGRDLVEIGAFDFAAGDPVLQRLAERLPASLRARQAPPSRGDAAAIAAPRILTGSVARQGDLIVVLLWMHERASGVLVWSGHVTGSEPGPALEAALLELAAARTRETGP